MCVLMVLIVMLRLGREEARLLVLVSIGLILEFDLHLLFLSKGSPASSQGYVNFGSASSR